MCFPKQPDPPAPPPPDPSVEAQKYASFVDSSQKIATEKAQALDEQRSKVYGMFGSRSLLGDQSNNTGGRSLISG